MKRLATLTRDVNGKFIRWKKGMRVKATYHKGLGYSIERLRWKKPLVPLMNCLCGVPRSALALDRKTGGGGGLETAATEPAAGSGSGRATPGAVFDAARETVSGSLEREARGNSVLTEPKTE